MKRNLVLLTGVTVLVLAAAALAVKNRDATSASEAAAGKLFADLTGRVNDVALIEVHSGEDTTTIGLEDGAWRLPEKGGYPAKYEKVKEAIVQIAELEIEEPKTGKPEYHAQLGVEDPATEGAESSRVTLKNAGGAVLASLIVGDQSFQRGSETVYVRRGGEDQVFLCAGRLNVAADTKSWLDQEIIRLPSDALAEVRLVHADGETIELVRYDSTSTQFKVGNLPEGGEERYEGVANGVATALSYLALDDVRPAADVDFATDPVAVLEYTKKNGVVVEVQLSSFEEGSWVKLDARYVPPPKKPDEAGPPAPEEAQDDPAVAPPGEEAGGEEAAGEETAEEETGGKETGDDAAEAEARRAEEAAEAREAALAEVDELIARHAGWAYEIPEYKATALQKRMSDLLKEEEPPETSGFLDDAPAGESLDAPAFDAPEPDAAEPAEQDAGEGSDPPVEPPADTPAEPSDDPEKPADENASEEDASEDDAGSEEPPGSDGEGEG